MKKLIIFLIFFSFSAHSADNYKCIYETSVMNDVIKKRDYMVGKEKKVKIDFKEKKLLDYPYKSISLQTKHSKDKAYGVIWGYEEVTWYVDVYFSDEVRRILFSLRYNELGYWATLSETMKLEDNVYSGHYFECEKSLFQY